MWESASGLHGTGIEVAPLALALGWVGCVEQGLSGPFLGAGCGGVGWIGLARGAKGTTHP